MTASHIALSDADFDALAVGDGSVASSVWKGHLSRRLALLDTIVEIAAASAPQAHRHHSLGPALQLIEAARRADRLAAGRIIMQPRVGAWVQRCLRQLLAAGSTGAGIIAAEATGAGAGAAGTSTFALVDFGSLAVTAAFAAGIDFELELRPTGRTVTFPGFGVAEVAAGSEAVLVRGRAGVPTVELDSGGTRSEVPLRHTAECQGWRPYRRIGSVSGGLRIEVVLDDVDPNRDAHGLGVATRLSSEECALWQDRLHEAWQLLATYHQPTASAIADGLQCVIPIDATSQAPELSATAAESFGAMYLTQPKDGTTFATALVHEFQHTKLSALIDLVPLQTCQPEKLFYAPWRSDARPLSGLLQGTYAYLGLANFMDVQRQVCEPHRRAAAEFEFARFRSQIWRASGSIAGSGTLTGAGHRFVTVMRRHIQKLRRAPVDPILHRWAATADEDHAICWRLANLACDEKLTNRQAEAYLAGQDCPVPSPQVRAEIVQSGCSFRPSRRLQLTYTRLAEPAAFEAMVAQLTTVLADATGPAGADGPLGGTTAADVLLAADAAADAARYYWQSVMTCPDQLDQWAGLSLARRRTRTGNRTGNRKRDLLTTRPELVQQVHRAVRARSGVSPDPLPLARWLSAAT